MQQHCVNKVSERDGKLKKRIKNRYSPFSVSGTTKGETLYSYCPKTTHMPHGATAELWCTIMSVHKCPVSCCVATIMNGGLCKTTAITTTKQLLPNNSHVMYLIFMSQATIGLFGALTQIILLQK